MKIFATLASLAVVAVGLTKATEYDADAIVPFVPEPEVYDFNAPSADAVNVTDALIDTTATTGRELQVAEGVIIAFQIAAAAAPLVAQIINGSKKECQQVACWVSTASKTCALSVAERVQAKMMMGKDRYRYESIQNNGMWVRYWRTKFEPADRGDIATGKCSNGVKFSVTNCQSNGQVHC